MMDKICPLSMIRNRRDISELIDCLKEQCMLWDNENNTCGIVTKLLEVIK